MANCPAAVRGAVTKVELTAGGADVIVTAQQPEAKRRIIELAMFHDRMPDWSWFGRGLHSGLRSGGGRIGHCPTQHALATVTTRPVPGGVRFELRADTPSRIKELQEAVAARAARLPGFASS
jgi:hypothetical protein